MTLLVFPDNTVLINFAVIDRMDLLEKIVAGRGQWCGTVAWESTQSAATSGLEPITKARDIFGVPLRPDGPAEHAMTRSIRERLAEPGDGPTRHLGESETIAIMASRLLPGIFVTDDIGIVPLAAEQKIRCVTTWDLLRLAHRGQHVKEADLWAILQQLRKAERGGPSGVRDWSTFKSWLQS